MFVNNFNICGSVTVCVDETFLFDYFHASRYG